MDGIFTPMWYTRAVVTAFLVICCVYLFIAAMFFTGRLIAQILLFFIQPMKTLLTIVVLTITASLNGYEIGTLTAKHLSRPTTYERSKISYLHRAAKPTEFRCYEEYQLRSQVKTYRRISSPLSQRCYRVDPVRAYRVNPSLRHGGLAPRYFTPCR